MATDLPQMPNLGAGAHDGRLRLLLDRSIRYAVQRSHAESASWSLRDAVIAPREHPDGAG